MVVKLLEKKEKRRKKRRKTKKKKKRKTKKRYRASTLESNCNLKLSRKFCTI